MKFTESELLLLQDYASKFLTISEIAILLNVDGHELRDEITTQGTQEYLNYHAGKLKRILELRSQEIELAKLGSTVAIELVSRYIENQKHDE